MLQSAQELLENSQEERESLFGCSLADLVRDFVKEWHLFYSEDSERAALFLAAISQLMEWKAMLLLPVQRSAEAEEDEVLTAEWDALDLEPFKQMALLLAGRQEEQSQMLRREPLPPGALQTVFEDPLTTLTLHDLQRAFQRIARRLLDEIEEVQIGNEKISRQECQLWLTAYLQERGMLQMEQLFRACPPNRSYWVVVFLLLLELIHQRQVSLSLQPEDDIWLIWNEQASFTEESGYE